MKCEKPIDRLLAQSSIAVASAPDCVTKASVPGSALPGAKLALRLAPGTSRPMQLAPRMRSRCGRAASSMACSSDEPSLARPCFSPALSTMAARVPLRPSSPTRSGTVAAGVQITARSGVPGSDSTSGQARSPSTVPLRRSTSHTGPLKPAERRLRHTTMPRLPGRSEIPMTATDRGANRVSRLRTLMPVPQCAKVHAHEGRLGVRAGPSVAPDQGRGAKRLRE